MRPIGVSEVEESLEWLDLYERTEITQPELAEILGISQGHLSRRLSLARRVRQRRESGEPEQDRAEIGDDDAEWLELVDRCAGSASRGGYYDLATDSTSHDGTGAFVFVGTGRGGTPRRNRLGTGRHVDSGQRYRPPDDGLKGGKG